MGWAPKAVSMLDLYTLSPRGQKGGVLAFARRTPFPLLHSAVLQAQQWFTRACCPQERTRRLRVPLLPMRSQGVVRAAEHVGKKLGVDSSQTWLHFGDGDKALLDVFKGDIIKWYGILQ